MNEENKWLIRGKTIWLYTKYQLLSKIILGLIVFPIFYLLSDFLIKSSGRTNLSSGDFLPFLLSFQGGVLLLLCLVLLIVIMGVDINAFIVISALMEERRLDLKAREVLAIGIRSIPVFFSPRGLLLAAYIAVVLPIIGIGISLTPFQNFDIPNFISSVIFNQPLYLALYGVGIIGLTVLTTIYIFTIHFVVIEKKTVKDSLKSSSTLIRKHWKRFLKDYILALLKLALLLLGLIIALVAVIGVVLAFLPSTEIVDKGKAVFFALTLWEVITYSMFLALPLAISILTRLFYKYNREDGREIHFSFSTKVPEILDIEVIKGKIRLKTKVRVVLFLVGLTLINIGFSAFAAEHFDELFVAPIDVQVVAHRAGGDLGAENTVEGVEEAIKNKAQWIEIDVQRTKDGKYIINHDGTFNRVAGVNKKSEEMTYDEIKKLEVKNLFDPSKPSQKVPSLEEILEASKGKIGVLVELKGKTADKKMVDDVAEIIKSLGMVDETVLLSLDYPLIEYIEDKHSDFKTGYLYYFATGDVKDLKGDYLIMEEREATESKIDEIHQSGKKAFVWTVNEPKSIKSFIMSSADGVITDHVKRVNKAIEEARERDYFDMVLDTILGF